MYNYVCAYLGARIQLFLVVTVCYVGLSVIPNTQTRPVFIFWDVCAVQHIL
jgi:hypothetical protein